MRCDQAGALEDFAVRTPTYLSVHGEWNRGNGRTVLCVGSIRALVCFTSVLYVRWFTLHRWIFFFLLRPESRCCRFAIAGFSFGDCATELQYTTLH
jgi:hypothetical protein